MAVFNWGIYAGIGLAFPIGRYVTEMNVGGLVSKITIIKPVMSTLTRIQ